MSKVSEMQLEAGIKKIVEGLCEVIEATAGADAQKAVCERIGDELKKKADAYAEAERKAREAEKLERLGVLLGADTAPEWF